MDIIINTSCKSVTQKDLDRQINLLAFSNIGSILNQDGKILPKQIFIIIILSL